MELLSQSIEIKKPRSPAGVLVATALVLGLLYVGKMFFVTLVTAVIIAFILEPVVLFFVRFRVPRSWASAIACALALGVLYLAGLGVYFQILNIWADLPSYSQRVNELVDAAVAKLESVEKRAEDVLIPKRFREGQQQQQQPQEEPPPAKTKKKRAAAPPVDPNAPPPPVPEVRIRQEPESLINLAYNRVMDNLSALMMASFVPFLVYFMLSWRDHIRRAWLNLFDGERRELAGKLWEGIATAARAFVVGNFLLGLLLALVSALFFWFSRLPYWQVIGPLSGFLSLIPYVGLPLSLIPPVFAALPVHTNLTAYLIIGATVALFHLLALNLLYPKVVGARVHLNPLAVTIALMLWYLLWGGAGLLLGIPITAGMKSVFDSVPSLKPYGRLLGD